MTAWRKVAEEPVRRGYRSILGRTFELPDGRRARFEIKDEDEVVAIVALTPARQVILVEQFRPGPEEVLFELPGGAVDANEKPLETANRELLEETGYRGGLQFVGTSLEDAYSTIVRHNYVALECERVGAPGGDEAEFTRPVLLSLEEFRAHLRSGRLTDLESGYLGLDLLGLL